MGEGTFVNQTKPLQDRESLRGLRNAQSQRALRLHIDIPLLLIVTTLTVFGLLMVQSSSVDASLAMKQAPSYLFLRQLRWVLVGVALAGFFTWFDYHKMRPLLIPMMAVTVGMLILVLVIRDERFNATRTLLNGSIQPSELAKLVIVIYLSFWLAKNKEQLNSIQLGLVPLIALLGFICGFIILQPDLSAAFTVIMIGGLLFFIAGGEWRQIILLLVGAVMIGYVLVTIFPTGSARITSYIEGLQNPIDASYQIRRSLEAVVKGQIFGVGIGNGSTKFIGLPVPATDSIFAVIAEETGLVGAAAVVALYLGLLWRGLAIARRAPDQLGALLAGGLTIWLTLEALINMTVIVGLVPIAGNALPFISAGGSNMVMSLSAIGIVMNVARNSNKRESEEGSSYRAVVDLRRRDGRRSVSRPNRFTSPGR
ncbi:MAG TPA: putative peptidoglycan glycosyltransferase FtsW [Anaerolineaceae bacterium]|nr:putative peptidoglycan glycosyltransferase FtsW [Anaerolineaceae bacterium]